MAYIKKYPFLSHLCGEEGYLSQYTVNLDFLSHLCGEEVLDWLPPQ